MLDEGRIGRGAGTGGKVEATGLDYSELMIFRLRICSSQCSYCCSGVCGSW